MKSPYEKKSLINSYPGTKKNNQATPLDASTSSSRNYSLLSDGLSETDLSNLFIHETLTLLNKRPKMSYVSNGLTLMQLLKGNIGTGILAIPSAFTNAGLVFGTFALVFIGILAVHCMHLLIKSHEKMCNTFKCNFLDYQGVAEKAVTVGPVFFRNQSAWAHKCVSLFLIITQFGFCCVYSLFVAHNVSKFIFSATGTEIKIQYVLLAELPIMILFSFVKKWKHVAFASTVANIIQIAGLIFVFYDLFHDLPPSWTRNSIVNFTRFPLYFGTAIYAFEGIGIILPLQREMKKPHALGGTFGVLNTGMATVTCLYTGIGFFGYLKYGTSASGSITMNWPPTLKYGIVQLLFAIAIFLSYGVQFYVPMNIIWSWFSDTYKNYNKTQLNKIDLGLRAFLVSFTFLIAGLVPHLDLVISLVGAFSSSCLALIFPPLIDIGINWYEKRTKWWTILFVKNILIALFGFVGFLTGSYSSFVKIIQKS